MTRSSSCSLRAATILACASVLFSCGRATHEPQPASPAATTAPADAAHAGGDPHWDYGQEHGPSAWGGLSPKFAACAEGRSQSPIDIAATTTAALPQLQSAYRPAALRIVHHEHKADVVNTGHSIQVNYAEADSLTVGEETFPLIQYHFHSPSEHTVNGRHSPMEMHLVHKSADGKLAVVGVFIEEGTANAAFDPIWSNLPAAKGVENHLENVKVDVNALLPPARTTYRYDGSLTTPPCSEGVKWFVMTTPIALSGEQIARFRALMSGNNRPVQPLNDRLVSTDRMQGGK